MEICPCGRREQKLCLFKLIILAVTGNSHSWYVVESNNQEADRHAVLLIRIFFITASLNKIMRT